MPIFLKHWTVIGSKANHSLSRRPSNDRRKNTIGCYSDTVWLKHLPKKHSCKKMKDIVINFQCRAKSFRINGLSSEIQYIFDLDAGQ